jgi:hypothetical protein
MGKFSISTIIAPRKLEITGHHFEFAIPELLGENG